MTTPNEILASVVKKFTVFYCGDNETAEAINDSLGTFQDKAGVVKTAKITAEDEAGIIEKPEDYCSVVGAHDSQRDFVEVEEDGDNLKILIDDGTIDPDGDNTDFPVTVYYFANLREWDHDEDLPGECVNPIRRYLYALLEIANTRRARAASQAAGLAVVEFPDEQTLRDRKAAIEQEFEEKQAMPMMFTIRG